MAGAFTLSKYETDLDNVVPIKVQPETLAANIGAANAAPAGDSEAGFPSADVSRSKRSIGIHARTVSIKFTATPPTGYAANSIYRIPILTKTVYEGISKGDTGTYLSVACQVVGKSPEFIV